MLYTQYGLTSLDDEVCCLDRRNVVHGGEGLPTWEPEKLDKQGVTTFCTDGYLWSLNSEIHISIISRKNVHIRLHFHDLLIEISDIDGGEKRFQFLHENSCFRLAKSIGSKREGAFKLNCQEVIFFCTYFAVEKLFLER